MRMAMAQLLTSISNGPLPNAAEAKRVVPRRLLENPAQAYRLQAYRPRDLSPATSYFVHRSDWQPGVEARALMQDLRRSARRPMAPL